MASAVPFGGVLLVSLVLVWAPVVAELVDECRELSPVSQRRARRARHVAEVLRSRVGDRSPEFTSTHGDSTGRDRAASGRDMPPAETCRLTVSAGGHHSRRAVCR